MERVTWKTHDGKDAWLQQSDGSYVPVSPEGASAQQALMERLQGGR